jgi:HPt (histidine-containing phosphotransfer) domain-containing protein
LDKKDGIYTIRSNTEKKQQRMRLPMDKKTYMQVIHEHMQNSYLLNEDKINTILPGFLVTLQGHLENVEATLAKGDLASLGVAGHTLKGALLNLGLFELADTAYTIEQQGKKLDTDTDYPALVMYLKKTITCIVE